MTDPIVFANVRYVVDDVPAAIEFYTTQLGFTLLSKPAAGNAVELFEPAEHHR